MRVGGDQPQVAGGCGHRRHPAGGVLTAVTPTSHDADVPADTGYFRNPLPLADGGLVAVHTPATDQLTNAGSTAAPAWTYDYRLKICRTSSPIFSRSARLSR